MKKILLGAVAVIAIGAAPALAADLPAAPVYTKAPPPEVVYNWTGFYIGGFVGGAWDRENAVSTALPAPGFGAPGGAPGGLAGFGFLPTTHNLNGDGFIGGLYAGYNWQSGSYVLGVEGDFAYLDGTRSNTQPLIATFPGVVLNPEGLTTVTNNNHWLGSLRGRVGYAWDHVMLYATGGVAFRDSGNTVSVVPGPVPGAIGNFNGAPGGVAGFNNNQVGYAVGVGGEWMISQNWILRAEYLHYGFQGSSGTLPIVGDTCTGAANCSFVVNTSDRNIDTARVGIAYKFGGPVVAKY
jgi:outer membrane immunogenic protein